MSRSSRARSWSPGPLRRACIQARSVAPTACQRRHRVTSSTRCSVGVRFDEYAERWLATKSNVRPRTLINVEGRLKNYVLPRFGTMSLSAIRPEDARGFVTSLTTAGLAPATVKATYNVLGQ